MNLQSLNETHAIKNHIKFGLVPSQYEPELPTQLRVTKTTPQNDKAQVLGRGDMTVALLENEYGSVTVSLYGGHVLSYEPTNHEPVIWMSRYANYEDGKAIRGGIPIIFPWFGAHPTEDDKPSHGFARRTLWQVNKTEQDDDGRTRITLSLRDTAQTRALWPHSFELCVTVTLGEKLNVSMAWKNLGDAPFSATAALHTYFAVADSTKIEVRGLENVHYLDQLDEMRRKYRTAPIGIWEEVDRIYIDSEEQCDIVDPLLKRTIHVAKTGSRSTVVWNPWVDKSVRMSDFGDVEYREMICVETANVNKDLVTLAPNESHETRQIIWVE